VCRSLAANASLGLRLGEHDAVAYRRAAAVRPGGADPRPDRLLAFALPDGVGDQYGFLVAHGSLLRRAATGLDASSAKRAGARVNRFRVEPGTQGRLRFFSATASVVFLDDTIPDTSSTPVPRASPPASPRSAQNSSRPPPVRPRSRGLNRRHGAECPCDKSCRRARRNEKRLRLRLTIQLSLSTSDSRLRGARPIPDTRPSVLRRLLN
jgi:hypothetical protein